MKIPPQKYALALANALENAADPHAIIKNLLLLLRRRKQFRALPKILKAFEIVWNKKQGIVSAKVTYPKKFEASIAELQKHLSNKLGKQIQIEAKSSDTLIGGFRFHFEDTLIDASVETRIKKLAQNLK